MRQHEAERMPSTAKLIVTEMELPILDRMTWRRTARRPAPTSRTALIDAPEMEPGPGSRIRTVSGMFSRTRPMTSPQGLRWSEAILGSLSAFRAVFSVLSGLRTRVIACSRSRRAQRAGRWWVSRQRPAGGYGPSAGIAR